MKKADTFDRNQHSVYLLYYHLILVVKYRRKVFDDVISERAKDIFSYIAPRYGITLEEWNHDVDHIHVMFRAKPATEISKFINAWVFIRIRRMETVPGPAPYGACPAHPGF